MSEKNSSQLRINVIANYLGQGWVALMGIAFVPMYIKYLGMEAYGLIGIFAVLQAWLNLLDMGMAPTLSREMARYTAGAHTVQSIRDLLRSMEFVCLTVAITGGGLVWFSAHWIAVNWLKSEKLTIPEISHAISVIGIVVGLRFLESLYRGVMLGLQKQVWLNAVNSTLATLRGIGAVFILMQVSPSIDAYFLWQAVVSVITIGIFVVSTYRQIPIGRRRAKFSMVKLLSVWRFAGGMTATAVLVLLLMQVDKIILSRTLSLESFGYYTFAGTVSAVLYQLTGPITQAYYPRLTELVTAGDQKGVVRAYHQSAQLICVLLVPAALVLALFGGELIYVWTGNSALANNTAPILTLLAFGTVLNGFMHMPYILTLAYGWPAFAVYQNIIAVVILIPVLLWVAPVYGAVGAAWIWVFLNAGYLLIGVHFLYKYIQPSEKWHWYFYDVLFPATSATIVAVVMSLIHPSSLGGGGDFAWLLITGILSLTAALLSANILRRRVFESVFS